MFDPKELLLKIRKRSDSYQFDPNHAYMYLEYMKMRFPKNIRLIELEQQKLRHTLMKIDTFSTEEKRNK